MIKQTPNIWGMPSVCRCFGAAKTSIPVLPQMATGVTSIYNECRETPIIDGHLQQMLTFIRGTGVEFLPQFDEQNRRKSFIDGLIKVNRLTTRIKQMAIRMMKHGRLLLYLRPVGKTYKIQDYPASQYRAYRDRNGDLESVVIIYSYKIKRNGEESRDRWVKIRLTAATIETKESDTQPDFETAFSPADIPDNAPMANPLGFLPCVEILNPAPATEEEGISDFARFADKIKAHDDMVSSIIDNLYFFANSPIVTNREASEVQEAMGISNPVPGYQSVGDSQVYASGFRETINRFPMDSRKMRLKQIKRVLGGFELAEGDSIQQLQVNPVPGELVAFADRYEQNIRSMLGGTSGVGLETATETSQVFAQVQATAREKQEALFTHGICEVLEMALQAEEALFLAAGGMAGLMPVMNELGTNDRTVNWRVGEVYKPSAENLNFRSITARNLAKFFGVSPRAAIQYVFPDKSETEIDQMVGDGGFPSDYLTTAIGVFQQLAQTVDPMTMMPVTDPTTGVPLAYNVLPFIINNLNYGQQFSPVIPDTRDSERRDLAALAGALSRVTGNAGSSANPLVSGNDQLPPQPGDSLPTPGSSVSTPNNLPGFLDLSRSPILNAFGIGRPAAR